MSKRARVSISIKCVWKTKERQTERRFFKEDFREQSFFCLTFFFFSSLLSLSLVDHLGFLFFSFFLGDDDKNGRQRTLFFLSSFDNDVGHLLFVRAFLTTLQPNNKTL